MEATTEKLIFKYIDWTVDADNSVVKLRLKNEEKGRDWFYKTLDYDKDYTTKDCQEFFDRTKLNDTYSERYLSTDIPNKKPHSWYQKDINCVYSFHKCFAMRNVSRLQYYRQDLSQKGQRNKAALLNSLAKFAHLKDSAEQNP